MDDESEEVKKPSRGKKTATSKKSQNHSQSPNKSKGPADKKSEVKKGKKGKKDEPELDELDEKFIGYLRNGKLKSVTVAELKEFLTTKNLPNKGNKNFMIELVKEYLENLGFS